MTTIDDGRRAIAANLRAVLPASEGFVSPYFVDAPKLPALQVVGVSDYEVADIGGGMRYEVGVEAMLGRVVDRAAQMLLDEWIHTGGVVNALDSSINPLTSRLLDNGTIAEEEADAGQLNYLRYGGPAKLPRGGVEVLIATWFCEWWPEPELFT